MADLEALTQEDVRLHHEIGKLRDESDKLFACGNRTAASLLEDQIQAFKRRRFEIRQLLNITEMEER